MPLPTYMARFGRLKSLGVGVGSAARKLRNRAGQFAFTGKRNGKAVRKGSRGRLLKRYATGTKRLGDKMGRKADRFLVDHPNMSNALMVASLAAGGLIGNRIGTAYTDSQKNKGRK